MKKSKTTVTGRVKKNDRVWDRFHYCLHCPYKGSNISKHLRTHKDKTEIQEILQLEKDNPNDVQVKKTVKMQLELLRIKGDHFHNISVIKGGQGELIIARRSPTEQIDIDTYGPCPKCLQWLKEHELRRHRQDRCIAHKKSEMIPSLTKLVHQCRILKEKIEIDKHISPALKTVLTNMRRDEITQIVQSDSSIILLGEEWLMKASKNFLRRANYTSERMRRVGKLLLELRKCVPEKKSFDEFLHPAYFDLIVKCVLTLTDSLAQFTMGKPSIAKKLKHDIVRMSETKEVLGIKLSDKEKQNDAIQFLKVMNKEWNIKIAITANATRPQSSDASDQLPHPTDLSTFNNYIKEEIVKNEKCHDYENPKWETYTRAISLLQAKLATYNKRRPGEVEDMK